MRTHDTPEIPRKGGHCRNGVYINYAPEAAASPSYYDAPSISNERSGMIAFDRSITRSAAHAPNSIVALFSLQNITTYTCAQHIGHLQLETHYKRYVRNAQCSGAQHFTHTNECAHVRCPCAKRQSKHTHSHAHMRALYFASLLHM